MNKIVGFIYSARGPFAKNRQKIKIIQKNSKIQRNRQLKAYLLERVR